MLTWRASRMRGIYFRGAFHNFDRVKAEHEALSYTG